jgi:trehalose-phosphatase
MKILNPEKNPSRFYDCLKNLQSRALLLDYDGTLAPFTTKRNKAFPYPGVVEILKDIIQNSSTRLVIVSGRALDDLIPLLGLTRLPEIWGSHGGERLLPHGVRQKVALSNGSMRGLETALGWLVKMGWSDYLERKPSSVAIHWRGRKPGDIQKTRRRLLEHLPQILAGTGLSLHEFEGGLEVRPPEITKGEAVEKILSEMPSDTVSAYLGDDLTDEDAFAALNRHGTLTLGVLVRGKLRETKADLWLKPPEELLHFLKRWEKVTSSP